MELDGHRRTQINTDESAYSVGRSGERVLARRATCPHVASRDRPRHAAMGESLIHWPGSARPQVARMLTGRSGFESLARDGIRICVHLCSSAASRPASSAISAASARDRRDK
jgi:hypothetical protein